MYVLVFFRKKEKENVSKIFFVFFPFFLIFFDFLESFFFEEGIEKDFFLFFLHFFFEERIERFFFVFLHFFEKKEFNYFGEIRERKKWISREQKGF